MVFGLPFQVQGLFARSLQQLPISSHFIPQLWLNVRTKFRKYVILAIFHQTQWISCQIVHFESDYPTHFIYYLFNWGEGHGEMPPPPHDLISSMEYGIQSRSRTAKILF